jgi:hypothetical protein
MIAKLEEYLDIFYEHDFYDIAISAKSMDAALVIDAYTEISKRFDTRCTWASRTPGPKETGCIRSRRRARHAAGQRHRRHHPHQLRQRPDLRSAGRARTALLLGLRDARGRRPHRVPDLRPHPGRPVHARAGREQGPRREDPSP